MGQREGEALEADPLSGQLGFRNSGPWGHTECLAGLPEKHTHFRLGHPLLRDLISRPLPGSQIRPGDAVALCWPGKRAETHLGRGR